MLCISVNPSRGQKILFRRERPNFTLEQWFQVLSVNSDNSVTVQFGAGKLLMSNGVAAQLMFADAVITVMCSVKNSRRVKVKIIAPFTVDIIREKLIRGTV